jgi:hypothetical protein
MISDGSENEDQEAPNRDQDEDADMINRSVTDSSEDKLTLADSSHSNACINFVTLSDISGGEFQSSDVVTISSSLNKNEDVESDDDEKTVCGVLMDVIVQQGFVRLTLKAACSSSESTHYRKNILKVGSSIKSQHGVCATIAELDAEWHRNQAWAQPTEHLGKHVRCKTKPSVQHSATSSDVKKNKGEENGIVWGWLPEGNAKEMSSYSCSMWRVVLESGGGSVVDLTSDQTVEARQRYISWKQGQFCPTCSAHALGSLSLNYFRENVL